MLDVGAGGGAADPQDAVNRPDGPPFRPGDAISVYLIKGDWVSAGTGTVTAVLGDTILAFGHSMFGGGEVALPIGRAQVFDVLPNQNISFKLSAPLEEVGMLTQDRMSAIVGTTARRATMLPLRVNIRNPNTKVSQTFSLELARHEFLTPRLMVYAMLNLMDVVENVGQTDSVVKYTIGLTIKGHAPVIIQDTFTNEPMPPTNTARPAIPEQAQMILHLFSILNNPFEKLELETVAMEFEVSHTKRKAPISMVWMDAPEIAAGSTATIHVNLKPYHHDPIHEQISMIIPASLPPGEYQIQVSGGHEAMVGRPAPESLEDLIARYDHRYTNQMLVAKLTLPFVRLTQQGVTMRSIPGSYVGTIVGNGTTNIGIERDTLEISKSTTWTVIGKKQLRLTITPKKTRRQVTMIRHSRRHNGIFPQSILRHRVRPRTLCLTVATITLASGIAHAATTTVWKVASLKEFAKGTLFQTVATSAGEVSLGTNLQRVGVNEIAIWSVVVAGNTMYLGTGNRGKIYAVTGDTAKEVFDTKGFVVTAMAADTRGQIFAATLPKGRLFIKRKGQPWALLAHLPDPYVWALLTTSDGHLYAATGPQGKLYVMSTREKSPTPRVLFDAPDDHILSLAASQGKRARLYCGTALNGVVYEVTPQGAATVIVDLEEHEARALAWQGGRLWIGANKVRKFDPDKFVKKLKRAAESVKKGKDQSGVSPVQELFNGVVYEWDFKGHVRKVWALDKTYLTHLAVLKDHTVLIGTGDEGKVYQRSPDGTITLLLDVPESQALTLVLDGPKGKLSALSTGNAAALYKVTPPDAGSASWTSEVHDFKFPARWGRLSWASRGKLQFTTRSGNTALPDQSWSGWTSPLLTPGTISSPPARYLQLKAHWGRDPNAVLQWTMVHAATVNQAPVVKDFKAEGQEDQPGLTGKPRTGTDLQLKWKADDPDGDELRYTVFAQRSHEATWMSLTPLPIEKKSLKWDTKTLQDGWYRFKVVASDHHMNAHAKALTHWMVTGPVLIDNTPPEISTLTARMTSPLEVEGVAQDRTSAISRIEYRLGNSTWHLVDPQDGVFDEQQERFRFTHKGPIGNTSVMYVRVFDAAGNLAIRQITLKKK